MKMWHFYSLQDGKLTGRTFSTTGAARVERNTPSGCGAIDGVADPHRQRVDLATGKLVSCDYCGPQTLIQRGGRLLSAEQIQRIEQKRGRIIAGMETNEREHSRH